MADMSKVGEMLSAPPVDDDTQPHGPDGDADADDPEAMGMDAAAEFTDATKSGDPGRVWSAFKMMMQAAQLAPSDEPPAGGMPA